MGVSGGPCDTSGRGPLQAEGASGDQNWGQDFRGSGCSLDRAFSSVTQQTRPSDETQTRGCAHWRDQRKSEKASTARKKVPARPTRWGLWPECAWHSASRDGPTGKRTRLDGCFEKSTVCGTRPRGLQGSTGPSRRRRLPLLRGTAELHGAWLALLGSRKLHTGTASFSGRTHNACSRLCLRRPGASRGGSGVGCGGTLATAPVSEESPPGCCSRAGGEEQLGAAPAVCRFGILQLLCLLRAFLGECKYGGEGEGAHMKRNGLRP